MMNSTNLVGRLARDMEFRSVTSKDGKTNWVGTTSVAVNREKFRKDAEDVADFIPCQVWMSETQKTGYFEKVFKKGALVSVDGMIKMDRYKNKENQDVTRFYVEGDMKFLQASSKANGQGNATQKVEAPQPNAVEFQTIGDDDIPF